MPNAAIVVITTTLGCVWYYLLGSLLRFWLADHIQ